MGGGLFCASVANILLVVSTVTDYWMQYRLAGTFARQGLWRYCWSGKCYVQMESFGKSWHGDGGLAISIMSRRSIKVYLCCLGKDRQPTAFH